MLITYLRWYRGALIAMRDRPGFKDTEEAKFIREHRGFCQPYVSNSITEVPSCTGHPSSPYGQDADTQMIRYPQFAMYGLVMCFLILIFNGVYVYSLRLFPSSHCIRHAGVYSTTAQPG
jgi:hypothetical protein